MANCGECLIKDVAIVALLPNGVCPRCGTDYGRPEIAEAVRTTARDHARAVGRGERLRVLADALLSALVAHGTVHGPDVAGARRRIFHVLANDIYGNQAIDIPEDL